MDLAAQFEELMQRSPIPPPDMKTFLREMRRTPSGTIAVSKLLASKIQSTSEAQAIHAFEFLETALESESEGSIEFRTEIGRYRFLNEIIRILSPKYLGDTTPEPVKERGTKFLQDAAGAKRKRWFPSEHSKVNSVYQSLVDGGIIQKPHRVQDEDAEFQKSIFERGENAVILKRLLQSKDPSDLQAANRLIKNLVDEEARRNERRGELHSLIDRIETTTGLLMEILSQPSIDKEIVDELVDTCGSLRQKLGGVATETNDEATSLLQASENIEQVLILYDSKKDSIGKVLLTSLPDQEETSATNSTATFATLNADNKVNSPGLSLADELLMNLNLGDEQMKTVIQEQSSSQYQCKPSASGDRLLLNLDVDLAPSKSPTGEDPVSRSAEPIEPFGEISKISREMMEQGLKGVPDSSQLKKTDKTPLSQLKKSSPLQDQPLPKQTQLPFCGTHGAQTGSSLIDSMSLLDLDFLDKPPTSLTETTSTTSENNLSVDTTASRLNSSNDENLLLDLGNEKPQPVANNRHGNTNGLKNNDKSNGPSTNPKQNNNSSKSSKTIITNGMSNNNSRAPSEPGFCLNAVRELDLECIDLLDDLKPMELSLEESCKNVSLTLSFGKYPEFPSAVNVVVITVTNRSKNTGLLNYVFQLLPPKGLQVKLLPPACMELPPWKKAFLPPPILTQVALILVSKSHSSIMTETQAKIKYILSCCIEEETILHNGDFSLPSCLLQL